MGSQASALLATLNTECVNADNLNESAAEAFRNHPDYAVITNFPGLGEATGARVLAEIGDDRGRFADARGLKSFAGAPPVTRASGRTISLDHSSAREEQQARGSGVCLGLRRHPETWPDQVPLHPAPNTRRPACCGAAQRLQSTSGSALSLPSNRPNLRRIEGFPRLHS